VLSAPVELLMLTEPEGVAEAPLPMRGVETAAMVVGSFEATRPAAPWASGGTAGYVGAALLVAIVSVGISLG